MSEEYGKKENKALSAPEWSTLRPKSFEQILGESPYKSPTDMGVNMAGNCIIDNDVTCKAARDEIIRRYYVGLCDYKKGLIAEDELIKLELLMKQANVTPDDRKVVAAALAREEQTGGPAAAMELPDGTILTGKTSNLLGAVSALLLNALKYLAGLDEEILLMSPQVIEPIQDLKVRHLGNNNPRIHTDETLLALSICANSDENAKKAMEQIANLRGCEVHSTVILSAVDERIFKRLGINLTCEPKYSN